MATIITREFLMNNVASCKPVEVECPEWGGSVLVERAKTNKAILYRERLAKLEDINANIGFIIAFCVNEDGSPLFTEADADWLGEQPFSVTNRLAERIAQVNGFTKETQETAEENFDKADS
jgi:hypothetical protein